MKFLAPFDSGALCAIHGCIYINYIFTAHARIMHETSTIACISTGTYLGCAKIEPQNKYCKIEKINFTSLRSAVLNDAVYLAISPINR